MLLLWSSQDADRRAAPSDPRMRHAGSDLQLFPGGVLERLSRRQHDRHRAHALVGGGGASPVATSAFAARIRRWRAMMMPLSVETRFSLVRSTIGPISSWMPESCMAKPAMPL